MPYSTYRALPLETLYELLVSSVRDMLASYETKQDNLIAFNTLKKQVEILLLVIEEKKRDGEKKDQASHFFPQNLQRGSRHDSPTIDQSNKDS